ncbi:MAG TPA: glucose-1-phosphate cytidylyltransferase [Polyangiales bacterium]|jgi:glucose-1-phosphate cytidylyltransferase|nr:glucose-1-phosphate cytidylyltransferase [Polyangiales bacterium]
MKVVILCGGMGMRLREETEYRPKPLVQIGGRPILWHIMKHYAHYGLKEFVLALGYRGEMIKEYFINYDAMNNDFTVRLGDMSSIKYHDSHGEQDYLVTLAETGLNSMTGGRVKRLARHIEGDTFMLTYGDGLADLDINALLAFHKSHGKLATVSGVRVKSRYGLLDLDNNGSVKRFAEKPQLGDWSSAGYFVLNKKIVDYITGDDTVLEEEPLRRLAEEGQLVAYQHQGCFYTMDTYREYVSLNEQWDAGNPPWKVWR